MRIRIALPCTLVMGMTLVLTGLSKDGHALPPSHDYGPAKKLVAKYHCASCHGADLKGKGSAPSLRVSGATGHYQFHAWQVLLNTGQTHKGGIVTPPMPVFHMSADDATAIYQYLYSLPH